MLCNMLSLLLQQAALHSILTASIQGQKNDYHNRVR